LFHAKIMKTSKLMLHSFIHSLCVLAYTGAIAWFLFNGERFFGKKEDNFLMPLSMLLLFVLSAAITGLLVLGRPLAMYLNGQKKEGVKFLFYTLGWLVIIVLIVFVGVVVL